ncbi:hypothetical protein EV702DRAFT_173586 [Suillus placidus]|uniref:Uncharacterized protein n=1 Tax=Suillus placidus TaxID=48579 RepID=A0A9P6ZX22_9AGAM|nr:hypothetical protein EV702DRAFT_173586 [Suillus placidus]
MSMSYVRVILAIFLSTRGAAGALHSLVLFSLLLTLLNCQSHYAITSFRIKSTDLWNLSGLLASCWQIQILLSVNLPRESSLYCPSFQCLPIALRYLRSRQQRARCTTVPTSALRVL